MAPVTPAEKAKRFREKNKVREQEVLREKLRRVEMKVSYPEKNKARLLKERLCKREYRKRVQSEVFRDEISQKS